jgi:hypothetical protein
MTLEQIKEAASNGQVFHWKTQAYTLKTFPQGGWWVVCVNGHVCPLNAHKAEDFFAATPTP